MQQQRKYNSADNWKDMSNQYATSVKSVQLKPNMLCNRNHKEPKEKNRSLSIILFNHLSPTKLTYTKKELPLKS